MVCVVCGLNIDGNFVEVVFVVVNNVIGERGSNKIVIKNMF